MSPNRYRKRRDAKMKQMQQAEDTEDEYDSEEDAEGESASDEERDNEEKPLKPGEMVRSQLVCPVQRLIFNRLSWLQ